ncbi:MAG: glycosyltransferase family 1 protein [Ardenticatenia bacterium]|nr:MAG: glycosyltransferase family 1 protein [Ardenticatenia bacterium]
MASRIRPTSEALSRTESEPSHATSHQPHKTPTATYHILMLAPTMFFADYGCHVRIYEEAIALRALGHTIRILAYPNGRDIGGLTVRRSPGVPFNYRVVVGSSKHKIYLDALLGLTSLHEVFANTPTLIHAHLHEGALIGSVLARVRRLPLIFDFQGSMTAEMIDHGFLKRNSPFYRLLWQLEKWIDHQPDAILTSSHNAADLLIHTFGVPANRIYPVPDCVNTDIFRPRTKEDVDEIKTLKQRLGIPADRIVITYLGLLAEYQGTGLLLEAAQRILHERRDVHFLIMGYPNEPLYRQRAHALGIQEHVTFTGRMPYEDAPRYLRIGDIAVAPKMSATEGSGKLLNYMATALPTVAFDTPVSREYLGEWGVYAEPFSAESFARALLDLLETPHEWPILGNALRRRVQERFSWDQAARFITSVYERVLR